jgi:hypothetical protein
MLPVSLMYRIALGCAQSVCIVVYQTHALKVQWCCMALKPGGVAKALGQLAAASSLSGPYHCCLFVYCVICHVHWIACTVRD